MTKFKIKSYEAYNKYVQKMHLMKNRSATRSILETVQNSVGSKMEHTEIIKVQQSVAQLRK